MKKTMKNAAIGLFTLLAVTTGFNASAGDPTTTIGIELKATGKLNNQPVFQLDLNNKAASKFLIVIKDEFGVTLHQEVVSGVNISRKYQLNTEELFDVDVRIEILDVKTSTTAVFNIVNSTRVVNETAIVKN